MKTVELIGLALDWAVAKALGEPVYMRHDFMRLRRDFVVAQGLGDGSTLDFHLLRQINDAILGDVETGKTRLLPFYSGDWSQGGPIIERERIKVAPNIGGSWHGQIRHEDFHPLVAHKVLAGWTNQHGTTPLVAAMRCFVASKLGDEIDVPKELL